MLPFRSNHESCCCGKRFLVLAVVNTEQTVERRYPVQPSDLFGYAVGSQQVPHPPVRPDNAQYGAPCGKFAVQFVQHAGATEIDIG